MVEEVICRWDNLACLVSTPCFTFIKSGQAVVVCVRFLGDIDSEYDKYIEGCKEV